MLPESTPGVPPTTPVDEAYQTPSTRPPFDPLDTAPLPARGAAGGALPAVKGFDLHDVLGRGGMGIVYRATQRGLNRAVALKMVLSADAADPRAVERFFAEAEAVAAVRHPNVVQVYEFGEHNGWPYLAMEYLPGGSLTEKVGAGPLPAFAAAELAATLAGAVAAAHAAGIVHRDLKPGNVLYDDAGRPKITDFGLAKWEKHDLTKTGAVFGTPAYMAPEQARGDTKTVGPGADVWALGVILYELLTGIRPFRGESVEGMMLAVLYDDPKPPRKVARDVPRDIELVCMKCLSKDAKDRYPTAAELAADLQRFAAGESISVRPAGFVERSAKWAKRKPTLAAAYALGFAVLATAALGGGAVWLWREASANHAAAVLAKNQAADEEKVRTEQTARDAAGGAYADAVSEAAKEAEAQNFGRVKELLAKCPEDRRGWEWHHLSNQARQWKYSLVGHTGAVIHASATPDGRGLATVSTDRHAKFWSIPDGKELWDVTADGGAYFDTVAVTPDGSRVVVVQTNDLVRVLDRETGKELAKLCEPSSLDQFELLSEDGRFVVTRSGDTVSVSATMTAAGAAGKPAWKMANVALGVPAVSKSGVIVLPLKAPAGAAEVADLATGAVVATAKGLPDGAVVRVCPDGRHFIAWTDKTPVAVWDARTGEKLPPLANAPRFIDAVDWSADGRRCAISSLGGVGVWDFADGRRVSWTAGKFPAAVGFAADGAGVIAARSDGSVAFGPQNAGEVKIPPGGRSLQFPPVYRPHAAKLTPWPTPATAPRNMPAGPGSDPGGQKNRPADNKKRGDNSSAAPRRGGTTAAGPLRHALRLEQPAPAGDITPAVSPSQSNPPGLRFSLDRSRVAIWMNFGPCYVFAAAKPSEPAAFGPADGSVAHAMFFGDSGSLLTSDLAGGVRVWDVNAVTATRREKPDEAKATSTIGQLTVKLPPPARMPANDAKGDIPVIPPEPIRFLDPETNREVFAATILDVIVNSAVRIPGGRVVVVCTDVKPPGGRKLLVYDVSNATPAVTIPIANLDSPIIVTTRDGASVAAACRITGRVVVADLATGATRFADDRPHAGGASAAAFSGDGKEVAVGYANEIEVRDARTGVSLRRLSREGFRAWELAFSPDATRAAAADGRRIGFRGVPVTLQYLVTAFQEVQVAKKGTRKVRTAAADAKSPGVWVEEEYTYNEIAKVPVTMSRTMASIKYEEVSTAAPTRVVVWDARTGRELWSADPGFFPASLSFSPDGNTLLLGRSDGSVVAFDGTPRP